FLSYLVGTCGALVGLGVLFAREAPRKLPYRALEVFGTGVFFATLTLLCIGRWRELFYPAVLFGGGLGALGVGVWQRHMLLVALPAAFLVLNAWLQYFAKFSDAVPVALLLMGFGLGLLACGV